MCRDVRPKPPKQAAAGREKSRLHSLLRKRSDFFSSLLERSLAVFLLDHMNALHLIDFWNLRALGWHVLPIPLKLAGLPDTQRYVVLLVRVNDHRLKAVASSYGLKPDSVGPSGADSLPG
jgi:hypothetical protein